FHSFYSVVLLSLSMVALRTEITPETVEFKTRAEKQTLSFEIRNTGEGVQMYKIKTTNANEFKIKPVYFSIEVKEKRRVNVSYLGKSNKVAKDRITIVYGHQINLKTTVEQAWEDQRYLQGISIMEKRKYVKIAFKDDGRRPDDSGGAQKSVMNSVMNSVMSKTIQQPVVSQSGINRDQDSYFAVPEGGPAKIARKGSSRLDPAEPVTEEGRTEDGGEAPPKTKKPPTRRKVAGPPPPPAEEEEEEAPPPPKAKKPVTRKKVQAPPPEEEEEAPRAPVKTRKPKVQQQEEEEEEAPPPHSKTKKPATRRKTQTQGPLTEEEEESPPLPSKTKKPATRRKTQTPPPPSEDEAPPPSKM
ncbi:hypothetical protein PMAYCL1PPCAC_31724, partial [Pristionchus mayeri]